MPKLGYQERHRLCVRPVHSKWVSISQTIHFVVHLSLPKSLEEYYQEAGRAGCDGKNSQCTIMYCFEDRNQLMQLISKSSSEEHLEYQMTSLNKVVSYCMSHLCRRKILMEYFNDESETNCNGSCDNCLKTPPTIKDYTSEIINLCHCVQEMISVNAKINIKQIACAFKGSKSKLTLKAKVFTSFCIIVQGRIFLVMTHMLLNLSSSSSYMTFCRRISVELMIDLQRPTLPLEKKRQTL